MEKRQRGAAITRCLLNQKGQGRAGQGRWDESGPLLCCALSGCAARLGYLSSLRAVDIGCAASYMVTINNARYVRGVRQPKKKLNKIAAKLHRISTCNATPTKSHRRSCSSHGRPRPRPLAGTRRCTIVGNSAGKFRSKRPTTQDLSQLQVRVQLISIGRCLFRLT